ncbi:hypothetical protein K505DRAFT_105845 [Melanomma pulvis-pyrius CBS 109.77]|uniref:Uncharacterized protein n=1 Tax=Melanomma pulvis-pyrius CBS 109.77 TaxID=1314802 RepID=A0A6A6WWY6_9PLEO|nr:hypothetical protein K505DRAFT_105845 [Melanomma pulvis-pyrius CBS 109.77]
MPLKAKFEGEQEMYVLPRRLRSPPISEWGEAWKEVAFLWAGLGRGRMPYLHMPSHLKKEPTTIPTCTKLHCPFAFVACCILAHSLNHTPSQQSTSKEAGFNARPPSLSLHHPPKNISDVAKKKNSKKKRKTRTPRFLLGARRLRNAAARLQRFMIFPTS